MADQEYLQNIAGSPHVDEGLGDRILSRGSSGLQRMRSMVGGEFSDPNYTKIQSLFNTFLKKVTGVLKDFSEGPHSVANRLSQMKPQITPQQQATIQQFRDLYSSIVPSPVLQHQTQQSILQPRSSRSQLTEMLKEGIFTRDMGLNAALYSNDPTKILNAYSKELKKSYDTFLADAMKVTGAPKDYVKRVVGNLNQKWSPILNKVEQVANVSSTPTTAVPPPLPTTPPENPPATPTPAAAVGTPTATTPPPTATAAVPKQVIPQTTEDDLVVLISNVVDVLVDAVKGDKKLSAAFFKPAKDGKPGYEPLPQSWEEPSITKEAEEPEQPEGRKKPGQSDEDRGGAKHEFLYNFHGLYDKQKKFAIDVPIHNKAKGKFVNRKSKVENDLEVVWGNDRHENNIYVKYHPTGEDKTNPAQKTKGGQILLFKFWDNQVNPRNPESNKFNVNLLLSQANQDFPRILAKANPDLKVLLQKKNDELQRALYATVSRKRMEWKAKGFQLESDEDGNVFIIQKSGNKVSVPQDTLKAHFNSVDMGERDKWKTALDKLGYASKFPDKYAYITSKEAVTIQNIPAAMDAKEALMKVKGFKSVPIMKAVQSAINALGNSSSADDYANYALKLLKSNPEMTSEEPKNPVSASASAPVTAPVSAPVSTPASVPVSAEPTTPVSTDKPKPEVAPSKPGEKELGKASWDDNGVITWEKPNGKVVKMTPKQLKNMKSPRLELLLKQQGYFDKFPAALKEWLGEELVDPFDLANLL